MEGQRIEFTIRPDGTVEAGASQAGDYIYQGGELAQSLV